MCSESFHFLLIIYLYFLKQPTLLFLGYVAEGAVGDPRQACLSHNHQPSPSGKSKLMINSSLVFPAREEKTISPSYRGWLALRIYMF